MRPQESCENYVATLARGWPLLRSGIERSSVHRLATVATKMNILSSQIGNVKTTVGMNAIEFMQLCSLFLMIAQQLGK